MKWIALAVLILLSSGARAEMIQAPPILQYAPNLLSNIVDQQRLPLQGALPAGSGGAIFAFAHLLGLLAVWKSLSMAWAISNTSSRPYEQGSWGGMLVMFVAGVMVFHLDKTMSMLAATIPGFPDLSPILSY